jgi:nucleoside-diphosphate-sugar epimerase
LKTLITGLEGLTGRYLQAELLAHGHEVIGLRADLTDAKTLEADMQVLQPDAVVHLAGISFVGHGDPNDFYRVNLLGTRNLLTSLAGCGRRPNCVLLASSANVYGNSNAGVLSEDMPPNPANDYAVSKLAMEYMARLWLDMLPIVIVRPFNYTGIGQSESFLIPKIVSHFRQGKRIIELGNLDVWRDFSDVRKVARAYRRLLEVVPAGETVNICSGRATSLREVLRAAVDFSGHEIEVRVNPALVRINEVRTLCGDVSKMNQLIGDCQMPPFQETLRWMIEAPA